MVDAFNDLLRNLRSVAEPTRLRVLAVLSRGEFSVTELTQILGQSQPRVSRHLKLLGDSGLLERFREQHWIYYRVPADTPGGRFARELLAMLDPADPVVAADRQRVAALLDARTNGAGPGKDVPESERRRHEDIAQEVAAELGELGHDALLYFGVAPASVIGGIARRARHIVGMNASRLEVQRARALLHSRGLSHCVLQQGDLKALPQGSASFDVVVLDCALSGEARPAEAVREAARVLKARGRLVLIEDYEVLEQRSEGGNPLALLREWVAEGGLVCTRLRPVDVGGAHLLMAVATTDREAAAA
jgi:DNA-binding transcriptional ArsR family regulator